jgi:NADH dehydrogenase
MVEAAQRAGVERFVFFSALGASEHHRARMFRAKALAEQAVRESDMHTTVIAPSLVYSPSDRWLTLIERLSLLPVMPISGRGRAVCQPIWAEDVAGCVVAVLHNEGSGATHRRYELAGPQTLAYKEVFEVIVRSLDRERPLLPIPTPVVSRTLRLLERAMHTSTPITWDEAELLEANMVATHGVADAQTLGVTPEPIGGVLQR